MGNLGQRIQSVFRRSSFIVDRDFQLRYTMMMLVMWTLSSAVFGCALAATIVQVESQPEDGTVARRMMVLLAVASVLLFGTLFALGIILTHRISGPIFVMSRVLDGVMQGSLPQLRPLRRNDELQFFFKRLGTAIEHLRSRENDEAAQLEGALRELGELGASIPGAGPVLARLAALAEAKRAFARVRPEAAVDAEAPHAAPVVTSPSV